MAIIPINIDKLGINVETSMVAITYKSWWGKEETFTIKVREYLKWFNRKGLIVYN